MDPVDIITAQWRSERPDLDVGPMGLIGRLMRIAAVLSREMAKTHAEFGLNLASFDVLATLLRSGAPYALSPNDLLATMMVTSGTMTNRIDQLEKAGLVIRAENPADKRSVLITLTPEGKALIDRAVTAHVATQARLVEGLSPSERDALNRALAGYMGVIGEG